MTPNATGSATFSPCGLYRYRLTRHFGVLALQPATVTWIMMNPSTADAEVDDPTIRRCIRWTQTWGYDGLTVVNLFALRSPYPAALLAVDDPVGPENPRHLQHAIKEAALVMCCWGGWVSGLEDLEQDMAQVVIDAAARHEKRLMTLVTNGDGSPRHPLYIPGRATPEPWQPPDVALPA